MAAKDRGLVIGSGQFADALARKLALEPGQHLELARRVVTRILPATVAVVSTGRGAF